jgi:hypothetical protein
MLAAIYNWFTEDFDTVHLKQAKALLDGLSAPWPLSGVDVRLRNSFDSLSNQRWRRLGEAFGTLVGGIDGFSERNPAEA